jgi:hypothetical protein
MIGSRVAQRRHELVQQVAVSGVDLDHLDAELPGPDRRAAERVDDAAQVVECQRAGLGIAGGVGVLVGPERRPRVVPDEGAVPVPGALRAALTARVRELHSGGAPLLRDEADDRSQCLRLRVVPEAEILRADPPLGGDGGRLDHHQRGAANGPRSEMHQVPGVDAPIHGRVLAHRRDENPAREGEAAQRERVEEARHPDILCYAVPSTDGVIFGILSCASAALRNSVCPSVLVVLLLACPSARPLVRASWPLSRS